ncbi:MAG: exodeoxyribonuclease VII small subunit [Acidiferrobacterales bacterium]|nr:exodeoxyribonuclease VII small subunit [Acidiferrobacterales bacterium]
MSKQDAKLDKLNFEQAYQELENIVQRMERGEQELEASLTDFERGVALMKHCHSKLKDAEQKVDILVKDNEGLFATEPFDSE